MLSLLDIKNIAECAHSYGVKIALSKDGIVFKHARYSEPVRNIILYWHELRKEEKPVKFILDQIQIMAL